MTIPQSPFRDTRSGWLASGEPVPLPVLVQAAIAGTTDDQIPDHALALFAELDERGDDSWREAGRLMIQHLLSGGHYGAGPAAAEAYLACQPPPDDRIPSLTAMHTAMARYIGEGENACAAVLSGVTPEVMRGAVRLLTVVCSCPSTSPDTVRGRLMQALCVGVR